MNSTVKVATVEYQPNLKSPVDPVPFGVIVEGLTEDLRTVVILGREPLPPLYRELQLADAWGPFLRIATEWVEILGKGIRELVEATGAQTFVVDQLAGKWDGNLYITRPVTLESELSIDALAHQRFQELIGVAFKETKQPKKVRRTLPERPVQPTWLTSVKGLQVGAGVAAFTSFKRLRVGAGVALGA